MSRDFYFCKVSALDHDIPSLFHPGDNYLDENGLFKVNLEHAKPWMLDIGKKVTIEYMGQNLTQLSIDKFGRKYRSAQWLMDNGYIMYDVEGNKLGHVSKEEAKKYETLESYEAVVFNRETLFSPDDNYLFYDMEDKLYTADELIAYADKIANEYGEYGNYEALYILYKCARLANQGALIWCEIC